MIYQDYTGRIMYSDSEGSIYLGRVMDVEGTKSFVPTRSIAKLALEPSDLGMIHKFIKDAK